MLSYIGVFVCPINMIIAQVSEGGGVSFFFFLFFFFFFFLILMILFTRKCVFVSYNLFTFTISRL